MTTIINPWDEPLRRECEGLTVCGNCPACRIAEYNCSITGLAPLEAVGSDRYFKAIIAEANRATAKQRSAPAAARRTKVAAPRVVRRASDSLSSQLCHACGNPVAGGPVWAHEHFPTIIHVGCAPEGIENHRRYKSDGGWVRAKVV